MDKQAIKKELYKQKPVAEVWHKDAINYYYSAYLNGGKKVTFKVPIGDMGDMPFGDTEQAQLLIRYII